MDVLQILEAPLIIFLAVVAPLWIIAHYMTRWRTAKTLSADEETMLSDLWESAAKMENRLHTLERILDAEAPGWRTKV
jgi:phage shock protein B